MTLVRNIVRYAAIALLLPVFMSVTVNAPPVAAAENPLGGTWQATELQDHPLAGRIWSRSRGGFITPKELAAAIQGASYLLLGEVHDNPDAHRLQAWSIAQSAAAESGGKLPVVMEMLNDAQRPALQKFFAATPRYGDTPDPAIVLFKKLDWAKSGWPSASIYKPIVDAVLAAGGRLYPGSAARTRVREIGKKGFAGISAARLGKLQLNEGLGAGKVDALSGELKEGHCNMLPDRAIPAMLKVQRFRDALMADRMVKAPGAGAILIAGNGHVRLDRAVPWYLRRMDPTKRILSVMALEVSDGENDFATYIPADPSGRPAADFIFFTPRQQRADQCEELRKMFKKRKPKQ